MLKDPRTLKDAIQFTCTASYNDQVIKRHKFKNRRVHYDEDLQQDVDSVKVRQVRADTDGRSSAQIREEGQIQQMVEDDNIESAQSTLSRESAQRVSMLEVRYAATQGITLCIPAKICGVETQTVVDSAAQVTLMSEEFMKISGNLFKLNRKFC